MVCMYIYIYYKDLVMACKVIRMTLPFQVSKAIKVRCPDTYPNWWVTSHPVFLPVRMFLKQHLTKRIYKVETQQAPMMLALAILSI